MAMTFEPLNLRGSGIRSRRSSVFQAQVSVAMVTSDVAAAQNHTAFQWISQAVRQSSGDTLRDVKGGASLCEP